MNALLGWMSSVAAMIIVGLVLFGKVGAMDAQDEQIMADHYTEMVCEGSWPDYKKIQPKCRTTGEK